MTEFSNAMEVFKLLNKSNCRKCNEQTCLAFASKVYLGQKPLDQCPDLPVEVLEKYRKKQGGKSSVRTHLKGTDSDQNSFTAELKNKIKSCELARAAERVGGFFSNGRLCIRIFGKQFTVDSSGNMISDIHINPWISVSVLTYILECKGVPFTGKWVPFRELKGGRERNGLFVQRSEKSFKKTADRYPGLFEDLIDIFNGEKTENYYQSDISMVLYPLPKLPLLVCYWKAEEGMDSDLHLFFDSSADMNANIDIVYRITAGIVVMFEKISIKHGV